MNLWRHKSKICREKQQAADREKSCRAIPKAVCCRAPSCSEEVSLFSLKVFN